MQFAVLSKQSTDKLQNHSFCVLPSCTQEEITFDRIKTTIQRQAVVQTGEAERRLSELDATMDQGGLSGARLTQLGSIN